MTLKHTSPEKIYDVEVEIPDVISQQKIANLLWSIDEKIANNNAINDNLEQQAKLLYNYWFIQFNFPDENGNPYHSSGGQLVWNKNLQQEIPQDWRSGNLYDIADYINGIACQKYRPSDEEHSLPVVKIREMNGGITNDTERVSSTIPAKNIISSGDILFSWSASLRGKGNPNEEGEEYKTAIGVLYAVAYTLKMSYKTDYKIDGFFEYVVPPLEGFWWQDNVESVDYTNKSAFNWISIIRMPDFIAKKDFDWAVETASKKKKMDCSGAEFLSIDEGLCVQIMHIGAFDDEPATVAMMDKYLEENGYVNDFTGERRHHEIYLSDPRKVAPEKCKTVIRHPIKKA